MRLLISLIVIGLSTLVTRAQAVVYESDDSLLVERLLSEAPASAGTLYFARQFIGLPYVAHTLELLAPDEQLIVNTRQLDCTTLVETVVALTLCHDAGHLTFNDYIHQLQLLRYRGGTISGYTSRLHYFSDWIIDNSRRGFVDEVQQPKPPFTAVQRLNVDYMSRHPQAYAALRQRPTLVETIAAQERELSGITCRYIHKSAVRNTATMRRAVHDGDIIAIVSSKPGLDIAHLGFAVWRHDGLHLLNASQIHGRVVDESLTLYQYLQKHPTHVGIRVVRVKRGEGDTL